jgi:hypothetical protein
VAIGRDPRCDVGVADPLMSRRHAEFVAFDGKVVVRDLGSRNGILVNGRRETEAVLRPGDVVQIAQVAITFLSTIEADTVVVPAAPLSAGTESANAPPPSVEDRTALLTPSQVEAVAMASAARRPAEVWRVADADGAKRSGMGALRAPAFESAAEVPLQGAERLPATPRAAESLGFPLLSVGAEILLLACLSFGAGVVSTMIWLRSPWTVHGLIDNAPVAVGVAFALVVAVGMLIVVSIRNVFLSRG